MLDAEEIAVEIARLEYAPSSYDNYSKLAVLYIIRDHIEEQPPKSVTAYDGGYSFDSAPTSTEETIRTIGDSPFLQAVNGRPSRMVWRVLDDLMETLAAVNDKVYNAVMDEIQKI